VQSDVTGSQGLIGSSRQVTWAYLDGGSGIGPFLAVSVHLDPDKSDSGERARTAFGRSLDTWVAGMHAARGLPAATPTVLMGDLNSFDARQPKGVQKILRSAGWKDAWDAPKRKNIDINSVNYSPTNRGGWPAKPIRNPSGVASRIDYIFYKGSGLKALSYEVVVRTDSAGRYVEKFRASDHNVVRAVISFS
jgi:endonuclease/exonuclease/phosphatase family metal-dependent hydrolase